jgi:hypothetical protein
MHARARTLVSIFALLLTGMLATVGPTAAAAEPYDETFCDVFTDEPRGQARILRDDTRRSPGHDEPFRHRELHRERSVDV